METQSWSINMSKAERKWPNHERKQPMNHAIKMIGYTWDKSFRNCYDRALAQYEGGNRNSGTYFREEDVTLLQSIGGKASELYDFAEDAHALDWGTALLITAARRDYFLTVQDGTSSTHVIAAENLPAKDSELHGIPWLPRLIEKARARLRGELPDELMYGCGGDRKFFKKHDVHPADFLRLVWAAKGDDGKILHYVLGPS